MIYENKLDTVLDEIYHRWDIPGLAVGIVEGEAIIYTRCLGVASLDTLEPVTPTSIFCVASISKCFVSSAVMQLVEQGKIDLDTPLVQVLPYFKLDDDRYPLITIRQVLSHTSGLPDIDEFEYMDLVSHPELDNGAAERFVRSLSSRKLYCAPGERFGYSNIGYNVLGDVIAKISGQTFEAYMMEHILLPAGMPDSTFLLAEVDRRKLSMPHLRAPGLMVNPAYPYHRGDAPSSFLHTTVTEMCHWIITSLNRGAYKGQRILTEASYDTMWTPVAHRGVPPFREEMGLGWNLGHFEGVRTVGHGGAGFGWTCLLVLLPEVNRGAIVLFNEESSAHEWAVHAVVRAMIEKEPQPGSISWMVPIGQALQTGGIQAAYARYEEIKGDGGQGYFFHEYELISMVIQLMGAGKIDLAIEVLKLNLHAYPKSLESYTRLADLYLRKGETHKAKAALVKALVIQPDDPAVAQLLEKVYQQEGR